MSHVKRRTSSQRSKSIRRRQRKRRLIGLIITIIFLASIILGIIFISL